jgi:hypothetical protein
MRAMKILTTFAFILLAGCAGAPPKTDPKTIEAPATVAADADLQTAADRRFAEEARGYKQVERNGEKYYCRSERASGSNIRTMNCFTEAELRARLEDAEMYRRRGKASVCAPNDPRCGGD